MKPMRMTNFEWQKSLHMFQKLNLSTFLNTGSLIKFSKLPKLILRIEKSCYNPREKKKGTSDAPSSKDMFVATRSRKPGRVYKESYEDPMRKIVEMEKIQTQ
ncbi:uncharacterized protein [Nicotiana tomentosiformis]|uniref:uncharacterized protein isoform X2 n=1 Tax=Nicotiana tomentosiformis TaxID=4098 RepID=UPI000878D447